MHSENIASQSKRTCFEDDPPPPPPPDDWPGDETDYNAFFWNTCFNHSYPPDDGTVLTKQEFAELSKAHIIKNKDQVEASQLKELMSFIELVAITLAAKGSAGNLMTSRWVLRWKRGDQEPVIKARLPVHGFKDQDADSLTAYAATASKGAQRLILSIAAPERWELQSTAVAFSFYSRTKVRRTE